MPREGRLRDLLVAAANGRPFDAVIVESIDRLSRMTADATGDRARARGPRRRPVRQPPGEIEVMLDAAASTNASRSRRSTTNRIERSNSRPPSRPSSFPKPKEADRPPGCPSGSAYARRTSANGCLDGEISPLVPRRAARAGLRRRNPPGRSSRRHRAPHGARVVVSGLIHTAARHPRTGPRSGSSNGWAGKTRIGDRRRDDAQLQGTAESTRSVVPPP